ncbi:hypothetical protein PHPALM_29210 [Phytophthora palmivora]|uniref:Uncharacterized protein n=1 Tax=Phytophthora palmivora TaxID=4796 RepID=A0A2P4X851_9STRA|nr:hypothetical protein PHPALM_29210 [Phytophthora palmivora]
MGKSPSKDSKQASASTQGATSSGNATPPAVDHTKLVDDPREAAPSDTLVDESESKEVEEVPLSGAASKSSGADMAKTDSKASAGAAASDVDFESKAPEVNQVDPPEFKTPRHATLEDVRGLLFAGMLRQEEVDLPDFLVPECPPHWKLPDPPNLKTNAYLVGVPGIVNDIRSGAFAMEGYGGATTLIDFEERSNDDLRELKEICGVRVDALRKKKELKRSWKFTCDYWFLELQEALGKLESGESEHKVALQEQKTRYQDEIDFLESERAELKARLADSEAQVHILKSRLESATVNPWKFSDFLQEHTDFTGNWERLHDLFKLCVKDTKPPESWDTVVNVAAMDKRKAAVAPYPEKSQRMPPSSGSDSTNRPEVLDLTGTGSNSQSGSGGNNETQGSKESQSSKTSSRSKKNQGSKTSDKQLQPTVPKVRKVQRRPKQPGRDSVRRAGEKTVVSKEAAHSMLPGGVVWKEVRPDVRQAILAGLKYDTAMEWIGSDRAVHGHFRQPQLVKMLVSMMYWRCLDKTPWSKYVPEAYYEMADERLDSTVDDIENDPEYQPPAQEPGESASSSSSEEEEEEVAPEIPDEDDDSENGNSVKSKEALESKPPAKRPRSDSKETSQDSNPKPKKQRRKATKKDTSAPQSSGGSLGNKVITRPKHPPALARKSYAELTYPSSTKSASCQTPGFPEYEIHKYSYDVVHDRWNRGVYQEILDSEPWVTMLQGRIRVFYFHERDMLYAKALKLVEDIVDVMHKHAQAIWERGHWVPIPTEEKADIVLESQRKSRHKCCYWIWEDPRAEELGGPACESLDLQLATLDMREPARVQWSTVIDDKEWLQYVPSNVKRHVKPVAIRKLNPLSLTHS